MKQMFNTISVHQIRLNAIRGHLITGSCFINGPPLLTHTTRYMYCTQARTPLALMAYISMHSLFSIIAFSLVRSLRYFSRPIFSSVHSVWSLWTAHYLSMITVSHFQDARCLLILPHLLAVINFYVDKWIKCV